jgi:hypothetical protein
MTEVREGSPAESTERKVRGSRQASARMKPASTRMSSRGDILSHGQ